MAAVAEALAGEGVACVRRSVTRPSDAGGEPHEPLTEADFAAREAAGGFALAWRAHGLAYGIPSGAIAEVAAGAVRLVNLSRSVVARAGGLGVPVLVVEVTASPATLAARLAGRGRESAGDIAARLAREAALDVVGLPHARVPNDGAISDARDAIIAAIRATRGDAADAESGS